MKNLLLFLITSFTVSCASSYPESHSREYYTFNAQIIDAVTLTYKDSFSVRTEPNMGIWVVGSKDKSFIDSKKEMLKTAAERAMTKVCHNYKITSDYNYDMHISTNTNELITSIFMTVDEKINPSYDKLPLNLKVEFQCK